MTALPISLPSEVRIRMGLTPQGEPRLTVACTTGKPFAVVTPRRLHYLRKPSLMQRVVAKALVEWFETDRRDFCGVGVMRLADDIRRDLRENRS